MASILILDDISQEGIEFLRKKGHKVDVNLTLTPPEIRGVINNYDAVIVRSRTKITREIIEAITRTRIIARAGTGLDNIDVEAAEKKNLQVLNCPEAVSPSAAELTIGLMLSLARKIPLGNTLVKQGEWPKGKLMGFQLQGKTLGLIGVGRIGSKVAKIASAMGMQILAYDIVKNPSLEREIGLKWASLEEVLRVTDFLSLHVPLQPETKGIIGGKELALMKPTAFLINAARGGLVDEAALYDALKENRLAGAGLDVFNEEPPKNHELLQLSNVVCTPHIGAQTNEAQTQAGVMIAEKVVKALKEQS